MNNQKEIEDDRKPSAHAQPRKKAPRPFQASEVPMEHIPAPPPPRRHLPDSPAALKDKIQKDKNSKPFGPGVVGAVHVRTTIASPSHETRPVPPSSRAVVPPKPIPFDIRYGETARRRLMSENTEYDEEEPTFPGAERVRRYRTTNHANGSETDDNDTINIGGHSSTNVLAQAELVDEPIIAAEVGADKTEELAQELEQERGHKLRQRWIAIAAISMVLVLVIVLASMLTRSSGGPGPDPPTLAPATEREMELIALIQNRSPTTTFDSSTSIQRLALNWLLEDPFTESLENEDRMVQRFALAVIYFATGGLTTWSPTSQWLDPSTECEWVESVVCDEDDAVVWIWSMDNGLSGGIPPEIGLLSSLSLFVLGTDDLQGTIPSQIGLLSALTLLALESNSLQGTIPTELGFLVGLTELSLFDNDLSGTIPTEIGLLTAMTTLDLSENEKLFGPLPTELVGLANLDSLFLNGTQLSGSLPSALCDSLSVVWVECGDTECECCSCP